MITERETLVCKSIFGTLLRTSTCSGDEMHYTNTVQPHRCVHLTCLIRALLKGPAHTNTHRCSHLFCLIGALLRLKMVTRLQALI